MVCLTYLGDQDVDGTIWVLYRRYNVFGGGVIPMSIFGSFDPGAALSTPYVSAADSAAEADGRYEVSVQNNAGAFNVLVGPNAHMNCSPYEVVGGLDI